MKSRLLFFAFTFFPSLVFACSCPYFTSFCEGMNPGSRVAGLQVVDSYFVDVDGFLFLWVDAVVVDQLVGDVPTDTLSFLVTDNSSCSLPPTPMGVRIGDRLAAFVESDMGAGPHGFLAYSLVGGCSRMGTFFTNEDSYLNFKENINDCILLTKTVDEKLLKRLTPFAPNPARDNLKVIFGTPLSLDLAIYTASGQLVFQTKIQQDPEFEINISAWAEGIYYVQFRSGEVQVAKRFLKI